MPDNEPVGFPRRSLARGALHQTRSDLLSLGGVFVTAVALGLANEVFPDAVRSTLPHRVVHGLIVVIATLALVALGDLGQRLALYRRRSGRAWAIRAADHAGLLGFAVDTRPPGGETPYPMLFTCSSWSADPQADTSKHAQTSPARR